MTTIKCLGRYDGTTRHPCPNGNHGRWRVWYELYGWPYTTICDECLVFELMESTWPISQLELARNFLPPDDKINTFEIPAGEGG